MKRTRIFGIVGALAALAAFAPLPKAAAGEQCAACSECSKPAIRQASLQDVKGIVAGKKKGVIVDSRAAGQFRSGHIPRAISIPIDEKMDGRLPRDKNAFVVFYCGGETCPLSTTAAEKAIELGYKNVAVFKDGWRGWSQTASR
jgi:rhodanese-related sulfurtransferase